MASRTRSLVAVALSSCVLLGLLSLRTDAPTNAHIFLAPRASSSGSSGSSNTSSSGNSDTIRSAAGSGGTRSSQKDGPSTMACAAFDGGAAASLVANTSYALFQAALKQADIAGASPKGVFLSGVSVYYALALALNAAGPSSGTYKQLQSLMQGAQANGELTEAAFNSELGKLMEGLSATCKADDGGQGAEFVLANSVWTKGVAVKPAYAASMQSFFKATAQQGTAADINAWVAEVTRGLIKDLIGSDNFDAVLANALYFKGKWHAAFKPEATTPRDFTTAAGAVKKVPMMEKQFGASDRVRLLVEPGSFTAVQLPYKGGDYAAVAVLPGAAGTPLHETVDAYLKALEKHAFGPGTARVVLPKFKVSSSMSLSGVLKALGVTDAFGGAADFSRLSGSPLFVSDVVHKAVVEVDEEGTVAAAATGIMMTRAFVPTQPIEVVFDRPFVFIIQHTASKLPLFTGVVKDPSD